jgi:hypothetical protein
VAVTLEDGKSMVVGYNPGLWKATYDASVTPASGTVSYEISVNGTRAPLPLAAVGAAPVDFQVGRFDVDHVDVTNADGTHKNVPGLYKVSRLNVDGTVGYHVASDCKTNSGLDVVPGKYKVSVAYRVTEGPKTVEYTIDVP